MTRFIFIALSALATTLLLLRLPLNKINDSSNNHLTHLNAEESQLASHAVYGTETSIVSRKAPNIVT